MSAPTSTKGYVDPYALGNNSFASLYTDMLEHVPDLTFPMSVPVYARMRRDPKLSSIVQGWTLNLRRSQWQLDPAGCRPEVVQLVADGTGLAIKGKDEPGAARLRGVSWGDHLNAALRCVPFGFSAFEMEAEITDKAQLTGLWERPQWTISHIHTDGKTGLLTGATQDQAAKLDAPQMPAKNLVWYAREREGSNWAGTSLLRASYASWLIKEEVRRHYGAANVRWAMGVPVMEALPGTSPTPAQMTEAMQMAAAARGGIQAGAASPPGFAMKILGISGSLPDSQAFLRWLDQQCTASALMGAFDLGETPNGSRALGNVFVDALHLALESEGEFIADVATRQIVARIVNWNFGEDEPVPRVVVSGVGSRREVTAESLQLLLSSGALAADPGLEAWVRREYRLPEREGMAPPKVTAPGVDLPEPGEAADGEPTQVAAAARPRGRRKRSTAQPTLFGDDEADAARIQRQWDDAKARLLKRWPKLAGPMVDELADQAEAAVEAGDLALLGELQVSAGVVAAVAVPLRKSGTDLAAEAAAGVVEEAAGQGVDIAAPDLPGRDRVEQHADAVARIIASGYASGAARISLQLAGVSAAEVKGAVAAHLTDLGTSENGLVGENIGGLLSAAQHAGRLAVLEKHPATAYRAVEVSDGPNRCKPCAEVNNRRYDTLTEALKDYPTAGYRGCLGRSRCRGGIHPIF
ncbi:phage portal protein family protein [Paractinoplanes toevensis]|uniref:Uncharacterized protein n=1 Tax=Paractinoplanes toevensis TaxID=571911 RepID=A0A919T4T8_9ACTN|nr:DUF935 family protein [Actinoplanes toevensis]GIM88888.1 hypothetical protein Ato02nite_006810 [Actinoplanes toevensis]